MKRDLRLLFMFVFLIGIFSTINATNIYPSKTRVYFQPSTLQYDYGGTHDIGYTDLFPNPSEATKRNLYLI